MYAAHAQIESRHFPRLDLASPNNPQRLSAHHHHRRQQPGAPPHHRRQPLPPPTTTIIDNNWARHVATMANRCHHPPPPSSGHATSPPVANRCHRPRPSLATHNHHWPPTTVTADTNHDENEVATPRHHHWRTKRWSVQATTWQHAIVTVRL